MLNQVVIALGSNIEKERNLPRAIELLRQMCDVTAVSPIYETEPVGLRNQPNFWNAAVLIQTDLGASEIKQQIIGPIETKLKRVRQADKNAPRTIDADIVLFNNAVFDYDGGDGRSRYIPDPDLSKFAHVAVPVADLLPHFLHPETGESLGLLAKRLLDGVVEACGRSPLRQSQTHRKMDKHDPQLAPDLRHRLQHLAGKRIDKFQTIQGGYTPALRLQITFDDSTTCFAKIGTTPQTVRALRQENRVYQALQAPFLPQHLGWDDDPDSPILFLEDLSHAFWPPPWSETHINQVLATLPQIWASSLPDVPAMADRVVRLWDGWHQVAENPAPFLALGLVTEDWLKQSLATLLGINAAEVVDGRSLLHFDLRSDNICFSQNRTIIIDWNLVCRGNAKVDLGFWLPSLEAEGGPPPEQLLSDAGEIAGLVSGFFAARAGLPTLPDAPRVRHIQLVQLKTALPWAVRALGLPRLDGRLVN